MEVHGHGSEWDQERGGTRYWIRLESGDEFDGFASTVESARIDARDALAAAGHPLAQLGGLASSILEEIADDEIALKRCPGGRALDPPLDYSRAFDAGTAIAVDFLEGPLQGVIEVETAGTLALPSGRVAAYDPLVVGQVEAFAFEVPPGHYPVIVSMANIDGEPRRRVIAAAVQFSEQPVSGWRQALQIGEDPTELAPREMFGYAVDTGTGCFADADFDPGELEEIAVEEYVQLDPRLVAFTTGWGDGRYATFLGRDALGRPAMLVTDFELLAPHSL